MWHTYPADEFASHWYTENDLNKIMLAIQSGEFRATLICFSQAWDSMHHMLYLFKVRNEFYKDTQGAMLVYDVGNRESFDALDSWLEEIKKDIGSPADLEGVAFAVCANKVRQTMCSVTICFHW